MSFIVFLPDSPPHHDNLKPQTLQGSQQRLAAIATATSSACINQAGFLIESVRHANQKRASDRFIQQPPIPELHINCAPAPDRRTTKTLSAISRRLAMAIAHRSNEGTVHNSRFLLSGVECVPLDLFQNIFLMFATCINSLRKYGPKLTFTVSSPFNSRRGIEKIDSV